MMKAGEANFLVFLKNAEQFSIPIFQRMYSWQKEECQQLWDDIIRTGSNSQIQSHFIGSIVYIGGVAKVIDPEPFMVIDGQQRLTTITLLLEALAREIESRDNIKPITGFTPEAIRNQYLLNLYGYDEHHYKLILTETDKDTLIKIITQREASVSSGSIRILENFEFFKEKIKTLKGDLVALCNGLAKLMVVDVALDRTQDNPQLIFESMNSTGRELSQADLIRNFILMGLTQELQSDLYVNYWRPMEIDFGQEAYDLQFNQFIRHYLTIKTGEIPVFNKVYDEFKKYSHLFGTDIPSTYKLVSDIRKFADYYCRMALGKEPNKQLADAFQDLRELRVDVAYPLLLEMYEDYQHNLLSEEDFVSAVRLVESYVFRRSVCNIPTNSMNKTFANFSKNIDKTNYLESIKAQFLLLPSYRRFPDDEEFKRNLLIRDLYNFPRRSYWLRKLENYNRKEKVSVTDYTIEHIMPQNANLSEEWRRSLGPEWERVHKTWLHTLGNLTLTGYNSEYSDRPFTQKRDMEGGFKQSPLKLNKGLGELDDWNEVTIQERAERLSREAVEVWSAPTLDDLTLSNYRFQKEKPTVYSIANYPSLAQGKPMRQLYEAFRKEVLALDPVITEEYLKNYIAFKAETNIVDVIPWERHLTLILNMLFSEINDPKGICRDVSNIGRWGNGDVEVKLSTFEELPYIIGLVRQALEKQLGNEDSLQE